MIRVPGMMMVIEMIIVMVKIAAMPVDTAPHPHSRATSEGMSATTVAATVGGSCDQWCSERCRKKATQENYKF